MVATSSTVAAPAGWYPDPRGSDTGFRWWDGEAWSRWLSTDASAPPPHDPPHDPPPAAPTPPPTPPAATVPTATTVLPAAPDRSVRAGVAVAAVVATVLAAIVVVGAAVSLSERKVDSGPAIAPPTPTAAGAQLEWDAATRLATVGELHINVPGAPYVCTDPDALAPVLKSAVTCNAPVHKNYRASSDWSATTGIGLIETRLVDANDTVKTGENLANVFRRDFYGGKPATLKKFTSQRITDVPSGQATTFQAEIHYKVKGVPSTYDRMVMIVVKLKSGQQAAWFSLRPGDTSAKTLAALDVSVKTIGVK